MSKYILPALLLLVVYAGLVDAAIQEPDIYPGDKIVGVATLGEDITQTIIQFERTYNKAKIKRYTTQQGGVIETGMGITLVYDNNNRIQQIITVDPELFTGLYIHVFSHQDDVLRSYGRSFKITAVKDGYYMAYPQLGIGFDIEKKTKRVRSIIIFKKTD